MWIDIVNTKTILNGEIVRLERLAEGYDTLRGKVDMNGVNLSGKAYGQMRKYCDRGLMPLAERSAASARELARCNRAFVSKLDEFFPGMGRIDMNELQEQLNTAQNRIRAVEDARNNPLIGAITDVAHAVGIETQGDRLIDEANAIVFEVQKQIERFEQFNRESLSLYDAAFNATNKAKETRWLCEAAWSPEGGYSPEGMGKLKGGVSSGVYPYTGSPMSEDIFYYDEDGNPHRVWGIATWNKDGDRELSCTFYTLRKLRERGLDFPFTNEGGSHNASEWFDKCNLGDDFKKRGSNAIDQLIEQHGSELKNIVIVFPAAPSNGGWGHVMLIDEVYVDENGVTWVKFSDNYPPINGDPNGSNPQQTMTLEQFNATHRDMTGAILIGGDD